VSVTKAERLRPILSRLEAFKPNEIEAMHLTGTQNAETPPEALVDAGVSRAYREPGRQRHSGGFKNTSWCACPARASVLVNATGAGDAAAAAIVWAGINGLSLEASARAAMKAGAIAICQPLSPTARSCSAERLI
jgi:pseudouridine kinase